MLLWIAQHEANKWDERQVRREGEICVIYGRENSAHNNFIFLNKYSFLTHERDNSNERMCAILSHIDNSLKHWKIIKFIMRKMNFFSHCHYCNLMQVIILSYFRPQSHFFIQFSSSSSHNFYLHTRCTHYLLIMNIDNNFFNIL
jgi:hypothetical protein